MSTPQSDRLVRVLVAIADQADPEALSRLSFGQSAIVGARVRDLIAVDIGEVLSEAGIVGRVLSEYSLTRPSGRAGVN